MRKKREKFYFFDKLRLFYASFNIEMVFKYEELFDCKFKNHYLNVSLPFKLSYLYSDFLNDIYSQKIQGFLVLKGLSIRKSSRAMYQGIYLFFTNLFF